MIHTCIKIKNNRHLIFSAKKLHGDNLDIIFLRFKKLNKNYIFVLHTLFTIKVQTRTPKLMYMGKKQVNTGN